MPRLLQFPLRFPALFFALWAAWLSLEYWGLGPFSYLFIHDNADQAIPFMTWVTRSPAALWNDPLVPVVGGLDRFSGTAWLVAHQFLFLKLPHWLAHGIFIAFQRFLCGYFTFRFLRDALRVRGSVALLAGLAYTLIHAENGELRLMHVFNEPGFPALLWGFARIPATPFHRAAPRFLLLSLLLGLGMGMVDAMPFFVPVAFVAGLILRDDTRTTTGLTTYTAWAAAICALALPWKFPGFRALLANAELSHRATWDAGLGWQDALLQLVTGRLPWLAGWWLVLLLALAWLLPFWRWRRRTDAAALWLLFAGLALGPLVQTAAFVGGDALGVLRGVNWFRFDRTAPLALLAAAALGLHRLLSRATRALPPTLPTAGVPVSIHDTLPTVPNHPGLEALRASGADSSPAKHPGLLVVTALLAGLLLHESYSIKESHLASIRNGHNWRALFQNTEIAALAERTRGQPVRVATPGAFHEFHPMFNLAYGLECADGYAVLYPDRYHRFWTGVLRPLMNREPYFKGHFEGWGSRVYLFHSQDPANASLAAVPFADWYNLDLLSLANVRYLVSKKPVTDPRLTLVPQAWTEEKRDAWSAQPARAKINDYLAGHNPGPRAYVYENPAALPRCFFAPGSRIFEQASDLQAALETATLPELSREVFLLRSEIPAGLPTNPDTPPDASVAIQEYAPSDLSARTVSPADGWLVCSNTFHPAWTCEIDGQPAPLVPAYGTFLAVRLPAGTHTVRWAYRPAYVP